MVDGAGLGESSSVLDFMSLKNYPDMSLDISMLNTLGILSTFPAAASNTCPFYPAHVNVVNPTNFKIAVAET